MAVDEELSDAVVDYFGRGTKSWPHSLPEAVISRFGAARGAVLVATIESIRREPAPTVGWNEGLTLAEETNRYEQELADRHPELSPEAIRTFGWDFAFSNK